MTNRTTNRSRINISRRLVFGFVAAMLISATASADELVLFEFDGGILDVEVLFEPGSRPTDFVWYRTVPELSRFRFTTRFGVNDGTDTPSATDFMLNGLDEEGWNYVVDADIGICEATRASALGGIETLYCTDFPAPSYTAVPEPSSAVLMLLGCIPMLRRRRV